MRLGAEGVGAQSNERMISNFAAQHSGAIVQKPEGPNTYDLKIWLKPSGNHVPAVDVAPGVEAGVEDVAGDPKDVADDVLAAVPLARRVHVPRLLHPVGLGLRDVPEQFGRGV